MNKLTEIRCSILALLEDSIGEYAGENGIELLNLDLTEVANKFDEMEKLLNTDTHYIIEKSKFDTMLAVSMESVFYDINGVLVEIDENEPEEFIEDLIYTITSDIEKCQEKAQ